MKRFALSRSTLLYSLWAAALAALFALHFVHLTADFPNFSPWMDYAKYTDEGWYGNAAIRHLLFGSAYLKGDFNPAAALPVWPLLLWVVFHFTGVSLVAARSLALSVFAANLVLSYVLLRRFVPRPAAWAGVTFLAASAYFWAFSRLAILEPLLAFFLLLSWILALRLAPAVDGRRRTPLLLLTGLVLALAVLTKTTAIFLIPSTLFLLWRAGGYRWAQAVRDGVALALGGVVPWVLYYLLIVRPRYVADFHYLFTANQWDKPPTLEGKLMAFWWALHGALWIDPWLIGVSLGVLAVGALVARRLWQEPLVLASLLAIAGYVFFIGWHNNPQPRYYELVAYPLVFIACLGASTLWRTRQASGKAAGVLAYAVLGIGILLNARGSVHFARHPQYTFITAAHQITDYIDAHPNGNRRLLSISGDDITLITHLPAICDDFGTTDLPYRIHVYQPGWYAAWNELDDGTLEDLHTQYSLEPVLTTHAFDDEDRDTLILYRLHPLPAAKQQYDIAEESAANSNR